MLNEGREEKSHKWVKYYLEECDENPISRQINHYEYTSRLNYYLHCLRYVRREEKDFGLR